MRTDYGDGEEARPRPAMGLFLLGCGGAVAELVLLEHSEDWWQWSPIILLAVGFVAGVVLMFRADPGLLRWFRRLMWLYLAAGALGVYLHGKSNFEFERELNPALGGGELVANVLMGAMPVLSPGLMILLGVLGMQALRQPDQTTKGGEEK